MSVIFNLVLTMWLKPFLLQMLKMNFKGPSHSLLYPFHCLCQRNSESYHKGSSAWGPQWEVPEMSISWRVWPRLCHRLPGKPGAVTSFLHFNVSIWKGRESCFPYKNNNQSKPPKWRAYHRPDTSFEHFAIFMISLNPSNSPIRGRLLGPISFL